MSNKVFIFFLFFIFQFTANSVYSQKKPMATLYIYRGERAICKQWNYDVQFYDMNVYTIKKNTALEYKFINEGKLKITIKNWLNSWASTVWLNIEAGKTCYIKIDCSLMDIELSTNQTNGKNEWENISKSNLVSLVEDPAISFLQKNESVNTEKATYTSIVKTDTVKNIVYVNTYKEKIYAYEPFSDVDFNVPTTQTTNDLSFALIIGNEDYSSYQSGLNTEVNVDFAKNDACAFKEYATKVMGIPEKNINLILDGTFGQISQAISKINLIAKNTGGKAHIVFYYAGHGMPDETTKTPYLIPVDISGANVTSGIKLKDVYTKLTEYSCERVLVLLDACFTGGARGEGLIAGRGISIKPKDEYLKGNIVVFSSSSGNQSSLSYKDKKHGVYTYFLLKKMQETKGDVTLKGLSDYLKEKVSLESVIVNNKEQNPQTNVSNDLSEKWQKIKLVK